MATLVYLLFSIILNEIKKNTCIVNNNTYFACAILASENILESWLIVRDIVRWV